MDAAPYQYFDATGFMPHGMCYVWRPEILGLHVVSDSLIALAYFSIPAVLILLSRKRPDLLDARLSYMFAAFITLCGLTHLLSIWVVWTPDYIQQGLMKSLTALVSIITAIVLWRLLPGLMKAPSTVQLQASNADLEKEIANHRQTEFKLHSQQQLVNQVLENLSDGVVACDETGRLMLFNKMARQWHGTDANSSAEPSEWPDLYNLCEPDGTTPLALENLPLSLAYQGHRVKSKEMCIVAPGKEPRLVDASGDQLVDPDGNRIGAVIVMHDITEQRKAEQALIRKTEYRVRKQKALSDLARMQFPDLNTAFSTIIERGARTLDVGRVHIWLCDDNSETMEFTCYGYYGAFGDQAYSNSQRFSPNQFGEYAKSLTKGQVMAIDDCMNDPRTQEFVDLHLSPDNVLSSLHVSIRVGGLLKGVICYDSIGVVRKWSQGEQDFVQSIADLCSLALVSAERKKAEESLRDSEERFVNLFEKAPDALIETGINGKIMLVNQQAEAMYGYSRSELIGKHVRKLLWPPEHALLDTVQKEIEASITPFSFSTTQKLHGLTKDGRTFPVEIIFSPLETTDGLVVMSSIRDVTERVRATRELSDAYATIEEERSQLAIRVEERTKELVAANKSLVEASNAKENFLAAMSHEIRTPMNGILGMLELLGLSDLNEEQRNELKVAMESGRSLTRIIDDILDHSKMDAGRLTINPEPYSLSSLLQSIESSFSIAIKEKALSLTSVIDDEISPLLMMDAMRIRQILTNFVSNSIKFTEQGGITIDVELVEKSSSTETIRMSVTDTGVGIKRENIDRLFTPYEQGDNQIARIYGGTGLGLSICKNLSSLMNGTIEIESTPGKGTAISIILTLENVSDEAVTQSAATESVSIPLSTSADPILIVDDNEVNLMVLEKQLVTLGLRVKRASSGEQALECFKAEDFSLVITDCHMANLNGYELAEEIRAAESGSNHRTTIIAWTASAFADDREKCVQAGMDDFISKPSNISDLLITLKKWVTLDFDTPMD